MTSAAPHIYLHHLARQCRRKIFRLPLPIFQVKECWLFGRIRVLLPIPKLRRVFVVSDISMARRILQDSSSDKPLEIYTSFEGITKAPVMFTSKNSAYTKSVRRMAHVAFSQNKKYRGENDGNRMQMITQTCVDQWLDGRLHDLSTNGKSFDPVDEALFVTFHIICQSAFCYEPTYEEFRMFTDNLDLALIEFAYRQSTNPLRKIFGFLLPGVWKAKRAANCVMEFAERMRLAYDASRYKNEGDNSFIDLMHQNPDLTDKQQNAEILMFMAAGHETTGSMIANAMILLAKYTEVQDRLRQSLLETQNSNSGKLEDCPYFKHILLEANRMLPVAPMGSTRMTGRDFKLEDGTIIPTDSICLLPQYPFYRDQDIFDNPNTFDPDRWQDSTREMNETASVTFSCGPRSCPGKPLAVKEMNYLLPRLLLRYTLHLETEGRSEYRVIEKQTNALLKVKEVTATRRGTTLQNEERGGSSSPSSQSKSRKKVGIAHKLFFVLATVLLGRVLLMTIHIQAKTSKSHAENHLAPGSLKIAVLTEPSPLGSYICGQSKRIEYLMQFLVENSNDTVELITTEVHDTIKPSIWRGIPVHYTHGFQLPSYNQISISFDFTGVALRKLYRFMPDIIHVTTPGPLLFPSVIASRLFGIPIVMSCHTHLTQYAKTYLPQGINVVAEWILWRYTLIVHSFADLTLVTSPQIQEDFTRNRIPRVEVWQKGVNATQFHPAFHSTDMRYRMTGGNQDDFLLVYIGRLADEKRLVVLKEVIQSIPGATLCLVGAGPYEQTLREYFAGTKTIFLGQLSGTELSQAFATADVFCMPSTSETLGFVVLESMASGTPVVAANAGGLKHLIENGTTGFLVTPDSESEFVSRIKELKEDPVLRIRIAEAARQDVEQWTWYSSMDKIRFHLYPRAIQNSNERVFN